MNSNGWTTGHFETTTEGEWKRVSPFQYKVDPEPDYEAEVERDDDGADYEAARLFG